MKPLIVIPARIGSTRLKNKPLREINGIPLITHVCLRALEADIGPVILSSDDERVLQSAPPNVAVQFAKGFGEHCGSDRVAYAAETHGDFEYVINLQGDLPFIDPQILRDLWLWRFTSTADIVSVIYDGETVQTDHHAAMYRQATHQHVGVYAFTSASLAAFARAPQTDNEKFWRLECHRLPMASWEFVTVDHMPLEINTESDLKHANLIAEAIWRSEDIRPRYRGASAAASSDVGGQDIASALWLSSRLQGRDDDSGSD